MSRYRLPSLEFNLSHACNLRCARCDHLSPYFSREEDTGIAHDSFAAALATLDRHVEIESFLLLGGEPLLNQELTTYLKTIDRLSPRPRVVLITNGFLLPGLAPEAYSLLDAISVSTYSSVPMPPGILRRAEESCAHHGVHLERHHHSHFGYNVLSEPIPDPVLVRQIFLTCSLAWKQHCHTLYNGLISRCSRAPFLYARLVKAGQEPPGPLEHDCLRVENDDGFAERLAGYLASETPLELCRYCRGSVGRRGPHRQLSRGEIESDSWMGVDYRQSLNRIKLARRLVKRRLLGRF